ncbi:S4 domain-containing protein [Demequina sp. B12]|uniref:RNA-binding S4 domain-containing protein n=1 Tax=Demequina sp. B12 TaxID=2992757 RepID=UPI00237B26D1|nr:S4 domain-containing protein [Demequina sp. B12]MDE0572079.1 S4 domain-containing protein [Demequina sp. B12]
MTPAPERSSVRADAWVWAVRLAKTRSQATAACKGGRVRVNGEKAKPSTPVKVGDRVEVTVPHPNGPAALKIVEARQLLVKRVGASVAAQAYVDHSPPPPPKVERPAAIGVRDRGTGRPTKKERRELDRLRGRRS